MKNLIKYSVFGSLVFTGSVASAWWCSTCEEDHKDGAVCQKTGTKPCDRCRGIHKPGAQCQRVFSDDEDLWEEKLKTPDQKEFSDKKGKREREKRKKDFREAENKLKELKLSEQELTCLLSFIQDRVRELGAHMVRLDNGVLEVIPQGGKHGYVPPRGEIIWMNPEIYALSHYRDNGHHGYNDNHGYVPPVNVGIGGAHGYVPPVQNDNHGYVPPYHGYNNNHGY